MCAGSVGRITTGFTASEMPHPHIGANNKLGQRKLANGPAPAERQMKVVKSIGSKPRPRTSDKERERLAKEKEKEARHGEV